MIATLVALEGQEGTGHAILKEAQTATHNEAACRLYALHVDEADPRTFVMIEIWDDDEALESHIASPHIQELIAKSEGVFTGPPELQRLNALPHGHPVKGAGTGAWRRCEGSRAAAREPLAGCRALPRAAPIVIRSRRSPLGRHPGRGAVGRSHAVPER